MRGSVAWMLSALALALTACGDDGEPMTSSTPARAIVRERIAALRPAAVLGHRGAGVNRPGLSLVENSVSSLVAAMTAGADGAELDVELTADGRLLLMHDDTLERTTSCSGCLSALSFDAARQCRLKDGDGNLTDEVPPTLEEVFAALPASALVNIELKVYGPACRTAATGAGELARATIAAVRSLGVAERVILSSFDEEALRVVKAEAPDLYAGFLIVGLRARNIQTAIDLKADAIHAGGAFPFLTLPPAEIAAAHAAGLQVNTWTVNDVPSAQLLLDSGVDTIITDEAALLRQVLQSR